MPRGDGTGPMGMGAMTGRGAGYCTDNVSNCGRGFGGGTGGGRGYRRMFNITGVPGWPRNAYAVNNSKIYDEKTALKNQEEALETHLKLVKDRLNSLNEQK